jgi:hypothetical protein
MSENLLYLYPFVTGLLSISYVFLTVAYESVKAARADKKPDFLLWFKNTVDL